MTVNGSPPELSEEDAAMFDADMVETQRRYEAAAAAGWPVSLDDIIFMARMASNICDYNQDELNEAQRAYDSGVRIFYTGLKDATPENRAKADAEISAGIAIDWSHWQ